MDIDLLKTFLEVNRTRHFGRAANNLFLTQSAVSARVRQLEEALGVSLFERRRNDIRLTPAGKRLLKHAELILNAWNRARQDTSLAQDNRELLAIGGMFGLWDILLQDWIHALHRGLPDLVLQAEAHGMETLMRRLLDGMLDVAFTFEPPQLAELQVQEVASLKLIMVSTRRGLSARQALEQGYVMVDWGSSFLTQHARHFPDLPMPSVRVGLGRMALAFLLNCGGAAYLVEPMVRDYLRRRKLHPVADAPVIHRQVYAVFPHRGARSALVLKALSYLRPGK
ncbi:MAG: LysR family transcriptional regulator [Gammaproteobacteria bacterium]|nr:LysR family transcriptional regulator [Gammaproteobacteria bacterium]